MSASSSFPGAVFASEQHKERCFRYSLHFEKQGIYIFLLINSKTRGTKKTFSARDANHVICLTAAASTRVDERREILWNITGPSRWINRTPSRFAFVLPLPILIHLALSRRLCFLIVNNRCSSRISTWPNQPVQSTCHIHIYSPFFCPILLYSELQ
jgi:hypothetical protein